MDGDVDYSRYDRRGLEDALRNLDAAKYPLNHANLMRKLAALPPETLPEALARGTPSFRRWLPWLKYIGAFQLFTAGFTFSLAASLSGLPMDRMVESAFVVVVAVGIIALNIAAAILVIRGKRLGYTLSAVNFALQVFPFSFPGVAFEYCALANVGAFGILTSSWRVAASLGPNVRVAMGGSEPLSVGVNVIALILAVAFVKAAHGGLFTESAN